MSSWQPPLNENDDSEEAKENDIPNIEPVVKPRTINRCEEKKKLEKIQKKFCFTSIKDGGYGIAAILIA